MFKDLLLQLEQKVEHAVDLIELLRLQIEELEEENAALRSEQEQWRDDLVHLLKRFEQIESQPHTEPHLLEESEQSKELA